MPPSCAPCSTLPLPPTSTGASLASRASTSYVSPSALPPPSPAHLVAAAAVQVMQSQMIGMQSSLDRILNAIQSQGQNQNPVPSPNQNQPMVPSPYSAGPSRDSPGLGASQSRCQSRRGVQLLSPDQTDSLAPVHSHPCPASRLRCVARTRRSGSSLSCVLLSSSPTNMRRTV